MNVVLSLYKLLEPSWYWLGILYINSLCILFIFAPSKVSYLFGRVSEFRGTRQARWHSILLITVFCSYTPAAVTVQSSHDHPPNKRLRCFYKSTDIELPILTNIAMVYARITQGLNLTYVTVCLRTWGYHGQLVEKAWEVARWKDSHQQWRQSPHSH